LERVEGGFGILPREHFGALRGMLPGLRGLAILDNDGRDRRNEIDGPLKVVYWRRYEAKNYFITPDLLRRYAMAHFQDLELFGAYRPEIESVLDQLVLERIFDSIAADFQTWKNSPTDAARLVWEARTARLKLSTFAEEFFRRLRDKLHEPMLLKKARTAEPAVC
jgi:hypothetical protein